MLRQRMHKAYGGFLKPNRKNSTCTVLLRVEIKSNIFKTNLVLLIFEMWEAFMAHSV